MPTAPSNLTAEVVSGTEVRLRWQDNSTNEGDFEIQLSTRIDGTISLGALPANTTTFLQNGLGPDFPYTFRVRARSINGNSPWSNEASVTIPSAGGCVETPQNLCLISDAVAGPSRFRVMVHWRVPATGANGIATAVANSSQTGLFWFFDSSNIELIVKVLDGRPINDAFWTFYGGLSDVEYWVSVTDVSTGDTATYHNQPGNICGRADVLSFPQAAQAGGAASPSAVDAAAPLSFEATPATPAIEAVCAAGPDTLCLLGGRFQLEVDWDAGATEGAGTAVPYGDASGFFWFFDASNIELVVKALDARPLNGKFWFFYGALSDVKYDIRVTDTVTGAVKTYHNAQGNLCGRGDTAAF